jgi:FkbM family methyltransferase
MSLKDKAKKYIPDSIIAIAARGLAFLHAITSCRLNIHAIKEEFLRLKPGMQTLGQGNFIFYNNLFTRLAENTSNIFIVDVGANDGWFARVAFRFAPEAAVLSFEPLKSQIPYLHRMKATFKNFDYRTCAIGEDVSEVEIHEYATSGLSSLLRLDKGRYLYEAQSYKTDVVSEYTVKCVSLDSFCGDLQRRAQKINILKIDTQGYELNVLRGARQLIGMGFFEFIVIEVLTVRKYVGAPLFDEIVAFLAVANYRLCDVYPSYREKNGWLTELDVVFTRRVYGGHETQRQGE